MPLECTLICLDDSEFMRNGDYAPNRLDSQQDAAALLTAQRINDNAESTVGVMSMAGGANKNAEVLVAPTQEQGKILAGFAGLKAGGQIDFSTSVQIAQLALKHRKNKTGGQRIIAFIGSPVLEETKTLTKIGKQLAKNNIAVSVVMLGELEENEEKMRVFVEQVNKSDNSHLVMVPPGGYLSDALRNSPIMSLGMDAGGFSGDVGAGDTGGGVGGAFEEYGGIDPSVDPELAMVMRQSLIDARRAEENRAKAEEEATGGTTSANAEGDSTTTNDAPVVDTSTGDGSVTDEQALELAARLSLESPLSESTVAGGQISNNNTDTAPTSATASNENLIPVADEDDEDAALALALALSVQEDEAGHSTSTAVPPPAPSPVPSDGAATRLTAMEALASAGLDANDPLYAAALAQLPPAPEASKNDNNKGNSEPPEKKKKEDKQCH